MFPSEVYMYNGTVMPQPRNLMRQILNILMQLDDAIHSFCDEETQNTKSDQTPSDTKEPPQILNILTRNQARKTLVRSTKLRKR